MSRPDPAIYPNGIQLACIGVGTWGKNLVRNFNALGALSWISEVSPERQADLSAQYPGVRLTDSLEPILSDPKVAGVAIVTPAETHGKLVRQVLLAGKDVFVEKPLCLSIAEGQELVSLASQLGRVLMAGHLLWYHPAVLKLQELVEAGELGRIQYIYSNRLNLGKIRREENILWSFAPHDVPGLPVGLPQSGPRGDTAMNEGGACPLGLPEVGYPVELGEAFSAPTATPWGDGLVHPTVAHREPRP